MHCFRSSALRPPHFITTILRNSGSIINSATRSFVPVSRTYSDNRYTRSALHRHHHHRNHITQHQHSHRTLAPHYTHRHQRRSLFIQYFTTPNPQSIKFHPTGLQVIPEGQPSVDIVSPLDAYVSPLAKALFKIDGVSQVFLSNDFVTVTLSDEHTWETARPKVYNTLTMFFQSGQPVLNPSARPSPDTSLSEDDDEDVIAIKEVLETKVRPLVQEDGGDVVFIKFVDGVVYVQLQGACNTCSSSTATLKNGIENMLSFYVPAVETVEQYTGEEDRVSIEALEALEKSLQKDKEQQQQQEQQE